MTDKQVNSKQASSIQEDKSNTLKNLFGERAS